MKRFIAIFIVGIAVALGSAGTAQAGDRHGRSSHHGHGHSYSRSHSSGYCAPQTYYRSYNYCPPTTYYRSYNSCPPRYSPPPCYRGSSYGYSSPGFSFFFRR
jgi:hypothetical protein